MLPIPHFGWWVMYDVPVHLCVSFSDIWAQNTSQDIYTKETCSRGSANRCLAKYFVRSVADKWICRYLCHIMVNHLCFICLKYILTCLSCMEVLDWKKSWPLYSQDACFTSYTLVIVVSLVVTVLGGWGWGCGRGVRGTGHWMNRQCDGSGGRLWSLYFNVWQVFLFFYTCIKGYLYME